MSEVFCFFINIKISDYGVRETTVKVGRKYITIKEKIPDIIVPDLDNFNVSICFVLLTLKIMLLYKDFFLNFKL